MQKKYNTVINYGVDSFEEKKSKFIANVKHINSEEDALAFINELKSKYWDASHNVYAYYLAGNSIIQRYSDDGEPSGTAGMPALEVIKRMEVQDVVVVITRYYGGTNLGASGLIRAYSKSAALGIEAAGIVEKRLSSEVSITIDYSTLGKVQNLLSNGDYIVKNIQYLEDVTITVCIEIDCVDNFVKYIEEATNARAVVNIGSKIYVTLDKEGKVLDK